jgi:hypothetical protein
LLLVVAEFGSLSAQDHEDDQVARKVRAQLEIKRTRASLGDTIRIRISLVNTSGRTVYYTPTLRQVELVKLVVKRDGKIIQPNMNPVRSMLLSDAEPANVFPAKDGGRSSFRLEVLEAHKTLPLNNGDWLPLTEWGYQPQEPGRYSIRGIPQIKNEFGSADSVTVRSNLAGFTIIK